MECGCCKRPFHNECVPEVSQERAGEPVKCSECSDASNAAGEPRPDSPQSGYQDARGEDQEQPGPPDMGQADLDNQTLINQSIQMQIAALTASVDRMARVVADSITSPVRNSTMHNNGQGVESSGDQGNGHSLQPPNATSAAPSSGTSGTSGMTGTNETTGTTAPPGNVSTSSHAPPDSFVDTRNSGFTNSVRAAANNPQSAIDQSIRQVPLTKSERDCRSRNTPLPTYDGRAEQWYLFQASFQQSTLACGWSDADNTARLKAALRGPALDHVKHLLEFPHLIGTVMENLSYEFARPRRLLSAAEDLAKKAPTLKVDLSNVAEYYVAVEHVRNIAGLLDECLYEPKLIDPLVEHLPVTIAREWLQAIGDEREEGTLEEFYVFIRKLFRESRRLHGMRSPATSTNSGHPPSGRSGRTFTAHEGETNSSCPLGCNEDHSWAACPIFGAMSVDERWNAAREHGRCFNCFGMHTANSCRLRKACKVPGCFGRHHKMLHRPRSGRSDPSAAPNTAPSVTPSSAPIPSPNLVPSTPRTTQEGDAGFAGVMASRRKTTLFRVVPVQLVNGDRTVDTYAFLDSGSSATLITEKMANQLGLSGPEEPLNLEWLNGNTNFKSQRVCVNIVVPGQEMQLIRASTLDKINLPRHTISEELIKSEELDSLPIEYACDVVPTILIGQAQAVLTRSLQSVVGKSGLVVASQTALGWVVEGQYEGEGTDAHCMFVNTDPPEDLNDVVQQYIERESFGLGRDDDVIFDSDENARARRTMEASTRFLGDRYETALLWKEPRVDLPNNKDLALRRHHSFIHGLKKKPGDYEQVAAIIRQYKESGFLSSVSDEDTQKSFYLPIFTVESASKPGKKRVVMDARAAFEGVSLNSALISGPDLTVDLEQAIIRFRVGEFAFTGDVTQMFHQVGVRKEDRWAQRIFWQEPGSSVIETLELNVLSFGSTCSPTLAQFVKNKNADRFSEQYPKAAKAIKENTYVDDHLQSGHDEVELARLARDVREVHKQGGFTMAKWLSNSNHVLRELDCVPSGDRKEVSDSTMVLGIAWTPSNDLFSFRSRFESLPGLKVDIPTKSELLAFQAGMYNPNGGMSFITVLPKILMREVWREPLGWNELIPENLHRAWRQLKEQVLQAGRHQVPRWYGTKPGPVELHVFCDASENAMAACVYVVQRSPTGTTTSLVLAKTKVAPLKTLSIPKLELEAALLGTRCLKIVLGANAFDVERTVMFTDAVDVLFWIRSYTRRYSSFVANRVGEILRTTEVAMWRWVPTDQNPADWATKWGEREDYSLWWHGPEFLHEGEDSWPDCFETPKQVLEERPVMHVLERERHPVIAPVDHFSSWSSFLYNVAVVMQATWVMCKTRPRGAPTAEEIVRAETFILRWTQEGLDLQEKYVLTLSPFQDENGLWRMGSRLGNARFLTYDAKYNIILPRHHDVSQLIIRHYHEHYNHELPIVTLNEMRQRFVLNGLRVELNNASRRCPRCILLRAKPANPQMARLPDCRLAIEEDAFTHVGIDCFGPLYVTHFRRTEKRHAMMCTCMTTRSVYIVLLWSLDVESCLMGLNELASRRKTPKAIYSDNGTNFTAAAKLFRGLHGERVEWRFNPPRTPHMGGAWERMIGITKRTLLALGMKNPMREDRLRHLLARAELIVNSRPLTDVPVDPRAPVALTPMMILHGMAAEKVASERRDQVDLLQMAHRRDEYVQMFWTRWTREYLPVIAARSKWRKETDPLIVGDLVYLCESDCRAGWRKGRIVQVFPDKSTGQVRIARVALGDGREVLRSATQLAVLKFIDV